MQLIQKNVKYGKKNIRNKTHREYLISGGKKKKLVNSSIVTTTYANIAKPTKNLTQNPRNGPSRDDKPNQRTLNTNIITQNLNNLTIKPHVEPVPKKHPQLQTNKAGDPPVKKSNNNEPQASMLFLPNLIRPPTEEKRQITISWFC